MKVPGNDKKLLVTNGKDAYGGTILYTKNIDLSEDGYLKLAAPMCKIVSSEDEATFGLPIDIFSYTEGGFKVVTDNSMFNFVLAALSVQEDTQGAPHDTTRVVQWVNNDWFLGLEDVYEFDGATGLTVYTSVIAPQLDYIDVFVNRNTLVGAFGDSVLRQYESDFSAGTHLILPDNFTITGAAFSNLEMGISTRQGKNRGDSFFFTWDGSTAEANNGYPVNDPYILDVGAYDSSWVIMTSGGEFLYFNGGSFEQLGALPIVDLEIQLISLGPSNSIGFGKIINVDGKKVYVNCASLPEIAANMKPYLPNFSAGAYCYDPKHGFYNLHAPSYSEYREESFTATSNILDLGANHYLETGDEVWSKSSGLGLSARKLYYAIKQTEQKIKLAASYEDALDNTSIAITNGVKSLFFVKRFDYGVEAIRLQDLGLVKKDKAFNGFYDSGALSFFLGAALHPNNVETDRVNVLCAKVPIMSNRGYIVYSRFQTESEEEMWQAIAVKYMKLKPGSSIIVKARVLDQEPIIVGDGSLFDTSYTGESVTWDANGDYFETEADLTDAVEGYEVHVFDGAGAGQTAHIKTIEYDTTGAVWQVTLDETLRGIVAGNKSCIAITAFEKIGTITSDDDTGMRRLPLGKPAESMDIKLELRGKNVKVKEVMPVTDSYQNG
jgi:hypothetical protein